MCCNDFDFNQIIMGSQDITESLGEINFELKTEITTIKFFADSFTLYNILLTF